MGGCQLQVTNPVTLYESFEISLASLSVNVATNNVQLFVVGNNSCMYDGQISICHFS